MADGTGQTIVMVGGALLALRGLRKATRDVDTTTRVEADPRGVGGPAHRPPSGERRTPGRGLRSDGLVVRFAAATTGLRPSELHGLRVGRLNLVKGTVEVAEALTVVAGRT